MLLVPSLDRRLVFGNHGRVLLVSSLDRRLVHLLHHNVQHARGGESSFVEPLDNLARQPRHRRAIGVLRAFTIPSRLFHDERGAHVAANQLQRCHLGSSVPCCDWSVLVRAQHVLLIFRQLHPQPLSEQEARHGLLLWGPTGTGVTRLTRESRRLHTTVHDSCCPNLSHRPSSLHPSPCPLRDVRNPKVFFHHVRGSRPLEVDSSESPDTHPCYERGAVRGFGP